MNKKYLTYKEAKRLISKHKIKSSTYWYKNKKNIPEFISIPSTPNKFYKDKGWISWMDFLGNNRTYVMSHVSFDEAKKFAISLRLKGMNEWRDYCTLGLLPNNMTTNPHFIYKNNGWINWGDFLGTNNLTFQEKHTNYYSYENAKIFMLQFNLRDKEEFYNFFQNHEKPWFLPIAPELFYKRKKVWISWEHFLSKEKKVLTLLELKKIVKLLNIQSKEEYQAYYEKIISI